MTDERVLFKAKQIRKVFGPTVALDDVSLTIKRGEIKGLIGENGSGKSTFASIAAGIHQPTAGTMYFKGEKYQPNSKLEGEEYGIGMIVQEMGTVSEITIAQNIFLGKEGKFKRYGLINKKAMDEAANDILNNIGFEGIDPGVSIETLDMEERKLVEVAKVMAENPEILVVDETTTALSQKGRTIIYNIMEQMKKEDKAVIFIYHDLQETMEHCDTLTVLRDGSLVTTISKDEMEETEEQKIKHYMVGRDIGENYYRDDEACNFSQKVVLDIENLTTGRGPLINFSARLHEGEILGIGGLSHCGMHHLGRAVFGEEPIVTGSVTHVPTGDEINSAQEALNHNMGYVSKNRDKEALVLTASIRDNIIGAGYDRVSGPGGLINPEREREYVKKQVDLLSIKCSSIDQDVQYLSGGNKQKVVFGKWIGRKSRILILDCPTRGVDIGVKDAMYNLMEEMKTEGHSILMISEELPELLGMCDRLIVIKDGRISGELKREEDFSENSAIELMI